MTQLPEDARIMNLNQLKLALQDAGMEPLSAGEERLVVDFLERGWGVDAVMDELRNRRALAADPDLEH